MHLMALDVGTKRIGVAKADSKVRIAIPYPAIEVGEGKEFQKIVSLIKAWEVEGLVVGLPRSNEGNETKQSAYVRSFAKKLREYIPDVKICFQDESLTSVEAEKRLKGRKKGYKKGDIDSEAAVIILQDFLEEKVGGSKKNSKAAAVKRKSVKGKKSHGFVGVLVTFLVLIVLATGGAIAYYIYGLKPVSEVDCEQEGLDTGDVCEDREFNVETGESTMLVAKRLKGEGLIRDELVFRVYVQLNSHGDTIKAGEYQLNRAMSVQQIFKLLLEGGDGVYSYTVLPGQTLKEVREDLIDLGYSAEEVDAALINNYREAEFAWIFEGLPDDNNSLEGYLYGDTYEFFKDDSAEAVVKRLLTEFAKAAEENQFKEKFAEHGLNMYQGVTLASVVQREANNAEDMAKVAQVFYNRLNANMPLGSDVTAKYAADVIDPNREIYQDNAAIVNIDSPYNTRKNPGLPYGPIANPGLKALNAVANPDSSVSEMLFFLTGDDGMMYYNSTEEGHNRDIIDHCQELCNVKL